MNARANLAAHLFASLLLATSTFAQTPATTQRLTALRTAYETAYQKEVAAVHAAALADLDAKYIAALDRALAAATQAGQLDAAVALRDEKKRVAGKAALPADDFAAPETLKTLRLTYRSALASLEVKRDQIATPVKAGYDTALEALQIELTKAGDLDGAIAIRATREGLKTEAAPTPIFHPQIVKEEPAKPSTPPTKTSKQPADDPEAALKLAEWAFACQRSVFITLKGEEKPVEIKAAADLPKGGWSLHTIAAGTHNPDAPDLFPWELLAKVPRLSVLGVNQKQPLNAEQAAQLRHVPGLIKLDVANMVFTLEALQAMPVFEKMDHLKLGKFGGDTATVMKLVGEKFPGLPILEVTFEIPVEHLPIRDDPLFNLKEISLWGHLSPEIIARLAEMPQLKSFDARDCRDEALPADLLLPIKDFRYLKLRRCKATAMLLPSLTKFENLDLCLIALNSTDSLSPADLEPLARLKSRRFEFDGGLSKNLTDEHVDALAQMKDVKEMKLIGHRFTPEGITRLKRALPKCKITY